jgi:hypothetical protein
MAWYISCGRGVWQIYITSQNTLLLVGSFFSSLSLHSTQKENVGSHTRAGVNNVPQAFFCCCCHQPAIVYGFPPWCSGGQSISDPMSVLSSPYHGISLYLSDVEDRCLQQLSQSSTKESILELCEYQSPLNRTPIVRYNIEVSLGGKSKRLTFRSRSRLNFWVLILRIVESWVK